MKICIRSHWPFTKMFQKIRLDFWGVSAENFREQRNIRKGTPGRHVINGDSYFIFQSYLSNQFEAFANVFQLMGLNGANGKFDAGTKLATGRPHEFLTEWTRAFVAERATKSFASDSWTKFTSPEICLPFAQTVNRSVCPYKWSTTRMSYCSAFLPEVYLRGKWI